jgi:hypothetical protein
MENIVRFKPVVLSTLLDLSNKHAQEVRDKLQPIFSDLQIDDLYLDGQEFVSGNEASGRFIQSSICIANVGLRLQEIVRFLSFKPDYRKMIIVVTDYYTKSDSFFINNIFNSCKNMKEDLDFYFVKIGKSDPEFEKIALSYQRSYYFEKMDDLIDRVRSNNEIW